MAIEIACLSQAHREDFGRFIPGWGGWDNWFVEAAEAGRSGCLSLELDPDSVRGIQPAALEGMPRALPSSEGSRRPVAQGRWGVR